MQLDLSLASEHICVKRSEDNKNDSVQGITANRPHFFPSQDPVGCLPPVTITLK